MGDGVADPFDFVGPDHFRRIRSPQRAQELFRRSIQMVEIETFSYCNRKCWFCPNAQIDRKSFNSYMEETLYLKILWELAQIDYGGMISYSRYNEPLADRIILTRLRQAREALPNVLLHTNTNGDYLNLEFLRELYEAGLRSLNIQIYLETRTSFPDDRILAAIGQTAEKLGLDTRVTASVPGSWHEAQASFGDMRIRIYGRRFMANGCDRAGLVSVEDHGTRCSPCLSPFYHTYIDFNGITVPCCNIRSDAPEHQAYIIGNIAERTLFELYADSPLVEWRKSLAGFGPKTPPCATCFFNLIEDTPFHRERALARTRITGPRWTRLLARLSPRGTRA